MTMTADAVLAQPGRCVECQSPLMSDAVVALCPTCCPHGRQFRIFSDERDGAGGRVHWDCIACGAEVEPGEPYETGPDDDGRYGWEVSWDAVPIKTCVVCNHDEAAHDCCPLRCSGCGAAFTYHSFTGGLR